MPEKRVDRRGHRLRGVLTSFSAVLRGVGDPTVDGGERAFCVQVVWPGGQDPADYVGSVRAGGRRRAPAAGRAWASANTASLQNRSLR